MKNLSLFFFLFLAGTQLLLSQKHTTLYRYRNMPCAGDSIIKQQMEYINPGAAGRQITWDFRSIRPVNDAYELLYKPASADSSQMVGIEHRTIYRYNLLNDSLLHTGFENTTTFMDYPQPELQMRFPFRYGDSIRSHFTGVGEYCHRIPLKVEGNTVVTADGIGTLYTPLGEELKNVLRVKRLRDYTETGLDSVRMQMEVYSWYVWGSRYPVFETVRTATQKIGKEEVEHRVASFFFPTKDQAAILSDTTLWEREVIDSSPEALTIDDIFMNCRMYPNPVETMLYVDYDLSQDATISFSLHDALGIAKAATNPVHRTAGHYTERLQMSGFLHGIYPLYVTVNGMVKTLHVMKR